MVGPSSAPVIVLAADDNPNNLRLLEAIIDSQGYTFFGARSGHECLAWAARLPPSLVILDVEMPDMDGYETCRRLRANEGTRRTPVAFFTAHRRNEDLRLGLAAGGNDFLLKPIDPAKLLSRVERLIRAPLTAPSAAKKKSDPHGAIVWV